MTAVRVAPAVRPGPVPPWTAGAAVPALAVAAGMAALLARPWLARATTEPTAVLVTVFVCIGMVGAWCALPAPVAPPVDVLVPKSALFRPGSRDQNAAAGWRVTALVTAAGMGAFLVGRVVGGGEAPVAAVAGYVALNSLAAVAEEALFRRLLYGLLAPWGAGIAVAGSATAFAVVHFTVWGAWALPLDLAAGLILSWQRWASGRWSVPAATHVVANLLVLA
jgi:membrane protease YdiL (CAAX protease family)